MELYVLEIILLFESVIFIIIESDISEKSNRYVCDILFVVKSYHLIPLKKSLDVFSSILYQGSSEVKIYDML